MAAQLLCRLRGAEASPSVRALLEREDTREPASFLLETIEPAPRARRALRPRPPAESIETLLSRLSDPSPRASLGAMEELGRLGPAAAAAVPALLQALDEGLTKEEAIRALGRIRSDPLQVVPALLSISRSMTLEREVESALIAYGEEAIPFVVAELRAALEERAPRNNDLAWLRILERAGPSAAPAIPELTRALKLGEELRVRERAARVLGAIGPAAVEAAPHLEAVLQNSSEFPSVLGAAWVALGRIRKR